MEDQKLLTELSTIVEAAVADALATHEEAHHNGSVVEAVKMVLRAGDFELPGGATPGELLAEHDFLREGQTRLEDGQDRMLDILIGPVATDWRGDPDPDGRRDEDEGMQSQVATFTHHVQNGGVPVKLPTSIKAAIYTASGAVIAAFVLGAATIVAGVIGG